MKTIFKLKIAMAVLLTGFLFSCKNNKDGYSDEIDTAKTPFDTASADTTNINNSQNNNDTNSTGATKSEGVTGAGSISAPGKPTSPSTNTKSTGTGPGPSAKDGSAYDISSQSKNDTTKLGAKALKKEKGSKE